MVETDASAVPAKSRSVVLVGRRCIVRKMTYIACLIPTQYIYNN
jgi:hypothetical protein